MIRQNMLELGYKIPMDLPYSSELDPFNYYLFRILQYSLYDIKLNSNEASENNLVQFFTQQSQKFHTKGKIVLPQKWQKVIDKNGTFLV